MKTDKQAVEEMARIFVDADDNRACWANSCKKCEFFEVDGEYCKACFGTKAIYNAGYRKQSVGEWIKTETNYTCSKCNFNVISWSGEYDGYECERGISLMKFCPNCGAKMKGGAEG